MTLKSVNTLLDVLHFADSHTAIIVPELGIRVTYDSLRQQVLTMANALASAGIRRGDAVAIALPNGLPAIVSFLAASIAGTAAPLNPAYPYEEFLFFLGDTNARVLLCPPVGAEFARSAAADRKIPVVSVGMTDHGNVHLVDAPSGATAPEPTADDIALVLHTSGSTGRPKRVPLRHFNLAVSSANIANTYALSEEDVSLCIMPLFHIHGLIGSTMATLLSGGTVVVPGKFNALSFWRTVREHRVTWYSGVPTMHQLLLARSHEKPVEAATLRFIRSCSAPLSAELIHKIEELFGVPFVEAYGMTEAAHQMTSNPLPPRHRKAGSVGVGTGLLISIMDREGNHLGTNQRGEVAIQGANVFRGYENNPEANARAFVNGWFRTGDEGLLDDDCYLHLTGRMKDIIIRGGENVAPHEVDEILLRHPAVSAAVTFGCVHPVLGEEVAAAVVLHQPGGATEAELIKHCREFLAVYKCPTKIYLVESIPTTATGKIRRRAVAAALTDDRRTGDEGLLDDDCYLHLTGRMKDIIIRGGENVAPHEVDEILLRHPAVSAAVTFGCVHPVLGEEVAAAVVLHQPGGATEAELIKHCREFLAVYKCPTKIYLVESIPTTATGKIRRRAVAAALTDDRRT